MNLVIESQWFGPVSAFVGLNKVSHIEIVAFETYRKMSFRNRCQVLGHGGVLNLTVPVAGGRNVRVPMHKVEIEYSGRWQKEHWRTLESCYNRSPFFFHYAPGLQEVMMQQPRFLLAYNTLALRWALRQLGWAGQLDVLQEAPDQGRWNQPDDRVDCFLPKNRQTFADRPYQQVFGAEFEPNLSILDLLFNLGPAAGSYLSA